MRNIKFNGNGSIDLEIYHDVYGWIPYTASESDPEEHGRNVYAQVLASLTDEQRAARVAAQQEWLAGANARADAAAEASRSAAYQKESDPLYFKWQRGEATEQEWLDKIAEIKARYPKSGEV